MFKFLSNVWKPLFGGSTTGNEMAKSNAKTMNNMAQSKLGDNTPDVAKFFFISID
jgi:hypothetical protein